VAEQYRGSVRSIRDSIFEHHNLVFGLAGLRRYGPPAYKAVAQVLEIPELRMLRLSWEFLEALIAGDDGDADALFTEVLGEQLHAKAVYALFGETF
jgi:hypothetical protein